MFTLLGPHADTGQESAPAGGWHRRSWERLDGDGSFAAG